MATSSLLPICFDCARLRGVVPDAGWSCDAFAEGIPVDIMASVHDHHKPYQGDGGLVFKAKDAKDLMPNLAADPPVSEAQRRAMFAAKAGHSNLGISPEVGKEYTEADPGGKLPEKISKDMSGSNFKMLRWLLDKFMAEESEEPEHQTADAKTASDDNWTPKGRAASVAFTTGDGRVLLLRRARDEKNWPNAWSFPGGTAEDDEDFETCAKREAREEAGDACSFDGMAELHRTRTPGDFEHATYVVPVKGTFEPKLSPEHSDWTWAPVTELPENTHPGVKAAIDKVLGEIKGKDVAIDIAVDETIDALAFDWSQGAILRTHEPDRAYLAFDRESVRDKDADGRLHVSQANISKANVCPYYGKEIPDFEKLRLDPEHKYMLLRHPDELKKAAGTFNNLPILSTHIPVTADSFPQDKIIGSTGSHAEFKEPYLTNSLAFWPQDAIDDIESSEKKELSAGYRYKADMTPGEFKGVRFDGVMRDIQGNHLALVKEGRAGADVVVGDAAIDLLEWGALERAIMALT